VATAQIERREETHVHHEERCRESTQLIQRRRQALIESAEWLEIKLVTVLVWLVWPGSNELLECLAGFRMVGQPVVSPGLRYRLKTLAGFKRFTELYGKSRR
jgi:hypothetical protein